MKFKGDIVKGDIVMFSRNCYSSQEGRELLITKGKPYRVLDSTNSHIFLLDMKTGKDYMIRYIRDRMIKLDAEMACILYGKTKNN